jgi:uncharacterized protein (TIGR02145 family)
MQRDKAIKWIATALAMMISATAIGQDETRTRPSAEDLRHRGTTYRVIEVSETDQYYNVYWKKWMLDDMKIFEEDNMLDMKTQKGYGNEGRFLSPVIDSIYFNHSAAELACPQGWRLPRIGEYDTLMMKIDYDTRAYVFGRGRGFRGYTSEITEGRLAVKKQLLKGGFWWCQAPDGADKADVVTVGDNNFYEVGLADVKDLASVRCVQDDERIKNSENE